MTMECLNILTPINYDSYNDPSESRAAFIDNVQGVLSLIAESPLVDEPAMQREAVKSYYQAFFETVSAWVDQEHTANQQKKNHPEAVKLKEQASQVKSNLEQALVEYALCMIEIHRSLAIIRHARIKYKNAIHEEKTNKPIEWSSGTSKMLMDNILRRKELDESTRNLALGQFYLEDFYRKHGNIEEKIAALMGNKAENNIIKPIRSLLRRCEFDDALNKMEEIKESKKLVSFGGGKHNYTAQSVKDDVRAYITILQKHRSNYLMEKGGSTIFLSRGEIRVALIAQMKELDQKEKYLRKYFAPYLNYVQKSFSHLRDKLQVVGSLDTLLTLYISLMSGLAQPMTDMKDIRSYESDTLTRVEYLATTQRQEIKHLGHLNAEDLRVYEENIASFEEVLAQKY